MDRVHWTESTHGLSEFGTFRDWVRVWSGFLTIFMLATPHLLQWVKVGCGLGARVVGISDHFLTETWCELASGLVLELWA